MTEPIELQEIPTTQLVDWLIERFEMSNANEFLTKAQCAKLQAVLNDPTTATV